MELYRSKTNCLYRDIKLFCQSQILWSKKINLLMRSPYLTIQIRKQILVYILSYFYTSSHVCNKYIEPVSCTLKIICHTYFGKHISELHVLLCIFTQIWHVLPLVHSSSISVVKANCYLAIFRTTIEISIIFEY